MLNSILQNIMELGQSAPWLILIVLLVYFFLNPDKISKWSSIVASIFEKISSRAARHSVESDIQSRINAYIKNNKAHTILPYGLKFKWIKDDNFSSYVEEDDVVVIMDYHENNARNFLHAIDQYISKAFLPTMRHDLPSEILTAAELTMKQKIIREKRPDALNIFTEEILPVQTADNDRIKSIWGRFQKLDILGHFDNIFLSEIAFAGPRLRGLEDNQKTREIDTFLAFLNGIEDEKVPLDYHGDVFCVRVILVAKLIKRVFEGTAPYLRRAQEATREKVDSIYVAGREQNMDFVDEVIDEIKKDNIGKLKWVRSYKTLDKQQKRKNAKIALF